jgi:3-isopropylmalate dehydrogenase
MPIVVCPSRAPSASGSATSSEVGGWRPVHHVSSAGVRPPPADVRRARIVMASAPTRVNSLRADQAPIAEHSQAQAAAGREEILMTPATIAVFPGDGIGPEVTREAQAVLDACCRRFGLAVEFEEAPIGGCAIDTTGEPLPKASLALAEQSDAVLLGAVGGPKWDDPQSSVRPEQALLGLRRGLGLFANLRPIVAHPALIDAAPLKRSVLDGVDILFVRELTGGVYFGQPSERRAGPEGREAIDTTVYSEREVERVVTLAFQLAQSRRKRVAQVDKANILATSRLWREVTHEVARAWPEVACEDVLVDAMAMHLLRRPRDFDVVVTENMFGDILTDEASVLTGSLGMLPSASVGEARNRAGGRRGLYEPIHGSAPDIAGKDVANPLGAILSAAMLLEHSLNLPAPARAIEAAVWAVIDSGVRTADVTQDGCRIVGCRAMGEAVRANLREGAT